MRLELLWRGELPDPLWHVIASLHLRKLRRRFAGNLQIPVCLYSEYTFESDSGVYEKIMTSKEGVMDNFSNFIRTLGDFQGKIGKVESNEDLKG